MSLLRREILQTLLYYDIWRYPLTLRELHAFLPVHAPSITDFQRELSHAVSSGDVAEDRGYYFVPQGGENVVDRRLRRQAHARSLWRMARLSMHVIKRCPFVRGVFVSGELSKSSTDAMSDVDFFIVTAPGRLWIARTFLILFKKIVLFNRKKYFCVNSFVTTDHLEVDERNVYQATEVAQLKPLYNAQLFQRTIEANSWIREFFPNFELSSLTQPRVNGRPSSVQRLLELPFSFLPADQMDSRLLGIMERLWARRYPQFDAATRARIFRSTKTVSRAYAGNFQDRILALYEDKLRQHHILD